MLCDEFDIVMIEPFLLEQNEKRIEGAELDILSRKRCIMPVFKNNHWILVSFDRNNRTITYFDSLQSSGYYTAVMENVKKLLLMKGENPEDWLYLNPSTTPQQIANDCGPFIRHFAKQFASRQSIGYTNINAFRQKMAYEISMIKKKLKRKISY